MFPKPDAFKTLHEIISKVPLSAASLMLQNILTVNIISKEFSILCPLINKLINIPKRSFLQPICLLEYNLRFYLQQNTLLPY